MVLISAVLLFLGKYQHSLGSVEYQYGPPAWLICKGLNAPALVVRYVGIWSLEHMGISYTLLVDNICFFLGIVLLWLLVAVEIGSSNRGSKDPVKMIGDVFLILLGTGLFLITFDQWTRLYVYSLPVALTECTFFLAWALLLVVYCGRDFVMRIQPARH